MKGWIDLFVYRILADVVGPTAAPVVFLMLLGFLLISTLTPFYVMWISRQVGRLRGSLATAEDKLDRLQGRLLETHTLVKESHVLVQERLGAVPPPVRFGPATPEGVPDKPTSAEAVPDGQGTYNYCPGCKEIKYIKFLRCQTCGYHVT